MRFIKKLFGSTPVKEELKESAIGAVCVWGAILLAVFTLKIFSDV